MQRTYDKSSLIQAYVRSRPQALRRPRQRAYYARMLEALESAFGVRLSDRAHQSRAKAIWMLFDALARSCAASVGPFEWFQEESLVISSLERLGPRGRDVLAAACAAGEKASESRERCEAALSAAFDLLYDVDVAIDSATLRAHGFDDAEPPEAPEW